MCSNAASTLFDDDLCLDASNAFNVISSHAIFDAIYCMASKALAHDNCNIFPGIMMPLPTGSPNEFHSFLPCLETYYGSHISLALIGKGTPGVQQGDAPASTMYAVGQWQHPVLPVIRFEPVEA